MSCFAEWAAVRWGPPPTPVDQVVGLPVRVDCDSQSLCDDKVQTWSWYPTLELVSSHCDTMKLDTVPEWWHGSRRTAHQRKKHVHCVGFFEQHMWGTTITYICLLCNINKYIINIRMLLGNTVTYKNVTPTYICCLRIKQHVINSRYYKHVV